MKRLHARQVHELVPQELRIVIEIADHDLESEVDLAEQELDGRLMGPVGAGERQRGHTGLPPLSVMNNLMRNHG